MRRKISIFVALMLLAIPLVSARINLNPLSQEIYNYGDSINIGGEIEESQDINGYLSIKTICSDTEIQQSYSAISLKKDQKLIIPTDLTVPKVIISPAMTGSCKIVATIKSSGTVIDSGETNQFTISKDLKGNLELNQTDLQKGWDDIIIYGTINKLNNMPFDGYAEIILKTDSKDINLGMPTITDGVLNFISPTADLDPGEYSLSVRAWDSFGNEQVFENLSSISISSELKLSASLTTSEIKPGLTATAYGDVKDINNKALPEGHITFKFNSQEKKINLQGGLFTYTFTVPKDIKSGPQPIEVSILDKFGNSAKEELTLNIIPIATTLTLGLSKTILSPPENIIIHPTIYDQANDPLNGTLTLEVQDKKHNLIYTSTIKSNTDTKYIAPKQIRPGTAYIYVYYNKDLVERKEIKILPVEKLEIDYSDEKIYLKNIGNIDYVSKVDITAIGKNTFHIEHKKTIAPNKTSVINLNEELPSGKYQLKIVTKDQTLTFQDVVILKGAEYSVSKLYIFTAVLSLFIIIFAYILLKKKGSKKSYLSQKERKRLKKFKKRKRFHLF